MTPKLRTHYAVRIFRSVRHLGETMWQPLCLYSNTSGINMTTSLEDITCKACQNQLVRHRIRLGLSRKVNAIIRGGVWS